MTGATGSFSDERVYSDNDDSPEAAIALRQRLNETVEQLDELRHGHAELQVNFEKQSKELTVAKSDRK